MPALIIDSGALLFKQPQIPEVEKDAVNRTAQGIARAMAAMDTQALGIAPHDLAAGTDFLRQLAQENNLTFVSMNLYPNRGAAPLFTPYLLADAGQMKIGILGLTGNLGNKRTNNGFHILPWQEILPKILGDVEKEADMIILLSSLPRKSNEEIAQKFDNIHVIFQSGQGGNNQTPVNINNTLLCQTAGRGKYAGFLQIKWNSSRTWGQPVPDQLQKEKNNLDRINWQIGRMQKRNTEQALAENTQFQRLMENKTRIEQAIQLLKENKEHNRQPLCSYENNFIALNASLPEDQTVKTIVDQTRREVNQMNRKALQERRKRQRGGKHTTGSNVFPEPLQEMAGWQACGECHPRQVAFYLSTDHAKAWQTLVAEDQQYNQDCVLCHVTLPTYDSRLVREKDLLGNLPQQLRGVGCETCHGPARKHAQAVDNVRPGKPVQAVCLQCHTGEHDKNFLYSERIRKVQCPQG